MTTRLTENLPLLAGTPNGIKKLRELILELAVRGKLVPQDPSDEPATELLKRITEEKLRLVAEGKLKKQKPLAEIDEQAQPFELPVNWVWTRLGEITNFGTTTKKDEIPDDAWVLDLEDIEKDTSRLLQKTHFYERNSLSDKNSFTKGDVLYGKLRPYLNKVLVAEDNGFCTTEILPFRCHGPFVAHYFTIALKSPYFLSFVNAKSYGMKMPRLGTEDGRQAFFPLPPLAEQHRIVAKVDELMALCDRLEAQQADAESAHAQLVQVLLNSLTQAIDATDFVANWQRVAAHFHSLFTTESSIDALKQTLLQLAVMGKLVPQDPNDEPASLLLKRIAQEKKRLVAIGKIRNHKPLAEIGDVEKSFELPAGWAWQRFADFALDVSTGPFGSLIHQSDYVDGGVPLVNPSHMIDGRIVPDHSVSLSPEMALTLDSYRLSAGDMVMARRGEVGRAAVVTDSEDGWLCGTGSFVLRFTQEVSRAYIWVLFRCNSIRTYLAGAAVGTTMVNLNHGILLKMPTAVPPLAEQHRIVAKVDLLMALCDQLKARLIQARQLNEQLASTLVEQAVA